MEWNDEKEEDTTSSKGTFTLLSGFLFYFFSVLAQSVKIEMSVFTRFTIKKSQLIVELGEDLNSFYSLVKRITTCQID